MVRDAYWELYTAHREDPASRKTAELALELQRVLRAVSKELHADAVGIAMVPRPYYLIEARGLHAYLEGVDVHVEARGGPEDERVLLLLWPDRSPLDVYVANGGEAAIALEEPDLADESR